VQVWSERNIFKSICQWIDGMAIAANLTEDMIITTRSFVVGIGKLMQTGAWHAYKEGKLIRLTFIDRPEIFCPLSAYLFYLCGRRVASSFNMPEFAEEGYTFAEHEIVEIAYAIDACNCGRQFDKRLRGEIIAALGLEKEDR